MQTEHTHNGNRDRICLVAHGEGRGPCFLCATCFDWIPTNKDGSLYIEPEPSSGVQQKPFDPTKWTVDVSIGKVYHTKDVEEYFKSIMPKM